MPVESSRSVALAVVSPTARPRRAITAGMTVAIAIGTTTSGLLLSIGVTLLVGATGLAGILLVRAGIEPLREALIAYAARRTHAQRRRARERALATATLGGRETLAELVKLADEIEASAPDVARRFEIEELLDRYATLAVAHEQAVRAAGMFDRTELERARDACRAASADKRRLDLYERRLRSQDQCRARVDSLANELALAADLIRLVAQRVACPDELLLDDRVDRQLAELDEDDAARSQLSAELR
ncbi:MAG TPA: hypothetical protein VGG28_24210 [Kofleriaceae bacterium]|jgi:hypothetical protein